MRNLAEGPLGTFDNLEKNKKEYMYNSNIVYYVKNFIDLYKGETR